ncbi:sigma-E factor regulatory protein RseB domain-containing protein [Streptomyces sp. B6B3]|uniref:LolA family protein n=1 Tax=Streptomyces sp. B6B3 TaxID=3153570 RepID=UPI00325D7ABD
MASTLTRNVRRAAVPTAVVAGIAAVGAGIWPALASDGSPDLPATTAEELLVQMAESETEQLSGTVRVDADLGIPSLPNMGGVLDSVLGEVGGPAGALAGVATGESTLRVAMDGPERQRLAVASGSDEFSVIHDGDELWAYDSSSNTVFKGTVPDDAGEHGENLPAEEQDWLGSLTPQQVAERLLDEAGEYADISVDGTARVAGRDAYQLLVVPTEEEVADRASSVRIAVDAETGVPLAVTIQDGDDQLLDVSFSQITYEQPAGGTFDFTPPQDAEVLEINPGTSFGGLAPELLPDVLSR